jgi:fluoroquinolone resistance protein
VSNIIDAEQLAARDSFENVTIGALGADADPGLLAGKELYRCTLRNIQLHASQWSRTRLEECVFESCDLSHAKTARLTLRDVSFKNCKLMGVDWSSLESYPVVRFESCNLRYASFVRLALNKTCFLGSVLSEASFVETQLVDASFEGCELSAARFDRCDLRRASFADTRGLLLDTKINNVKGARIPVEAALRLAELQGLIIAQ